jgi:hypothetical protein
MPHIKYARATDDFSFAIIHGTPPPGSITPFTPAPPAGASQPVAAVLPSPAVPSNKPASKTVNLSNDLMDVENIENVRLWLPSDVPGHVRNKVSPPVLPVIAHNDELSDLQRDSNQGRTQSRVSRVAR